MEFRRASLSVRLKPAQEGKRRLPSGLLGVIFYLTCLVFGLNSGIVQAIVWKDVTLKDNKTMISDERIQTTPKTFKKKSKTSKNIQTAGLKNSEQPETDPLPSSVDRSLQITEQSVSEAAPRNSDSFFSSEKDLPTTPTPGILGDVTDALTKKPIGNATLLIDDRHISLNENGEFQVFEQEGHIANITCYCDGYEPISLKHKIGFRPGPLRLTLRPSQALIEGTVVDNESGNPVKFVHVKIGLLETQTDREGKFVISRLTPTYHQFVAQKEGYMDSMEVFYLNPSRNNLVFKIRPINQAQQTQTTASARENNLISESNEVMILE